MKKILISALGALLTLAACSPVQKLGRKPVEGVEGLVTLHPVENSAKSDNGKDYYYSHDYLKRYLYITDDTETHESERNFLLDSIGPNDSLGRGVTLQSATIDPLSSLTPEVRQAITKKQGIEFSPINQYQIAKSFNIKLERNSTAAKQQLLDALTGQSAPTTSVRTGRLPIDGAQGLLTLHPIMNRFKGVDGKYYYFFYDYVHRYIFVTDDEEIYKKFSNMLPSEMAVLNAVIVQGIAIDPLVLFTKTTIDEMTRDQGFQINGGPNGKQDINKFTLARISRYCMVTDYKAVVEKLRNELTPQVRPAPLADNRQNNKAPAPVQEQQPPVQQQAPAPVYQQPAPQTGMYNKGW